LTQSLQDAKKLRVPDLKETPIERINRLKRELRELKENLESIRQRVDYFRNFSNLFTHRKKI